MAKLRGVVLAAGRGVRMGGAEPKPLIPLDGGEPLLHHVLEGLRHAGVDDLLVVTGFRPDAVQSFVDERWGGGEVTYVFNARYASWGNFHTLRLAVDQSPGHDLLVSNSDIVLAPAAYERVAGSPGELVLAVQMRPTHLLDAEDMRVEVQAGRVRSIGKGIRMARSHGEFAGASLLRGKALRVYSDLATDAEWRRETSIYYEDVFGWMLDRVDARAARVELGEYAEVDTPDDVARAKGIADSLKTSAVT